MRRLDDLAVATVPFAFGLVGPGRHGGIWSLPLSTVMGLPLYWRRRYPLAVLAACFAAGAAQLAATLAGNGTARVLPGFYDIGIVIAVYSAAAYGDRAARLAALAGGTAGAVCAALVWVAQVRDTMYQLYALCVLFAPVLSAWALGIAARSRRDYLASVEDKAERLRRERDALARVAVAEERERIARELHDIVAHSVSVMIVASDGAEAALEQDNPGEARQAIAAIGRTGRAALSDLRLLVGMLRGDRVGAEPQPGIAQLQDLIDSIPLKTRLDIDGEPRDLPQGLALAVFRIVQEALTNAVKHAGPDASADVRLRYDAAAVAVEVSDDGAGPASPSDGGGHGLIGMRERAAMSGGTLTAGPGPSGGFRVAARLPWA